jgi:hypothetical protein
MKIKLVHSHFDTEKLEQVKKEMLSLGAPKIHAVWMECHEHWAALEGCHRIRAAKELGLKPVIVEVGYSDQYVDDIFETDLEDCTISEIADDVTDLMVVEF